jgi:hypothetical protein
MEKKWEYNGSVLVHQLIIHFKKAYNLTRGGVLDSMVTKFGIAMKLVMLIEMGLNETYSTVCIGKNLSAAFPIQNGLRLGDASLPYLNNFALEYAIKNVQ